MKFVKNVFLTILIFSLLIQPVLAIDEVLWVSEYTADFQDWDDRNAPSPYLANESIGYIHEVKTSGAKEGYFGFENPSGNGIINNVTLYLEGYGDDINDKIDIYLDCSDGSGWIHEGTITIDKLSYDWFNLSFTNRLNNWVDIQNAQIYFSYVGVTGGDDIYVRRAYLKIFYEPDTTIDINGGGNPEKYAISIYVVTGTLNTGNLASTFSIDGNWYNVSEENNAPGLDIRVNFTNVRENMICGCIEIYQTYTGHSQHDIKVQAWNFTSNSWKKIGKMLFNETSDWVCIGFGHYPESYVSNGNMWFRLYHPESGHTAHELHIDKIDMRVYFVSDFLRPEGWVLTIMIAAIGGTLIILGTRRRRR